MWTWVMGKLMSGRLKTRLALVCFLANTPVANQSPGKLEIFSTVIASFQQAANIVCADSTR